jgi:putative hydrolase of the HAD superfamily
VVLRAIFFDIDDTLYSTSTFAERARENSVDAMLAMGVRASRETLLRELEEVVAEFSSNYEHHYDKLLTRLPFEATAGLNQQLVVAAGVVAYHETKFRELASYDDVTEVLRILSGLPLILGIVTAGLSLKQMEKLIRLRVHPYINSSAVLVSDQVGIGKPNPKLYLRAVERVRVQPHEAMYVGDHPLHDVDAAKAAGLITVWNRREGKHLDLAGRTMPDHVIYNFWDLLEVVERRLLADGVLPAGSARGSRQLPGPRSRKA